MTFFYTLNGIERYWKVFHHSCKLFFDEYFKFWGWKNSWKGNLKWPQFFSLWNFLKDLDRMKNLWALAFLDFLFKTVLSTEMNTSPTEVLPPVWLHRLNTVHSTLGSIDIRTHASSTRSSQAVPLASNVKALIDKLHCSLGNLCVKHSTQLMLIVACL